MKYTGSWRGNDARDQAGFDGFMCVASKDAGYLVEREWNVNVWGAAATRAESSTEPKRLEFRGDFAFPKRWRAGDAG